MEGKLDNEALYENAQAKIAANSRVSHDAPKKQQARKLSPHELQKQRRQVFLHYMNELLQSMECNCCCCRSSEQNVINPT